MTQILIIATTTKQPNLKWDMLDNYFFNHFLANKIELIYLVKE